MRKKPRKRFNVQQPPRKITPDILMSMRKMREMGKSYELIADLHGVSKLTAWEWLTGRRKFCARYLNSLLDNWPN